jgi:competence protein ComEA
VNFFGKKVKGFLLLVGAVLLCVFVVWPFLRGGGTSFHTAFRPMNVEMKELLSVEAEDKESRAKAQTTPKATPKATPKGQETSKAESTPKTQTSKDQATSKTQDTSKDQPTPDEQKDTSNPAGTASPTSTTSTSPDTDPHAGLLDLNTATLEQLDKLPGIGESKAKAILDYRLKKGRFKRVEELMDVKGIGEKMFEKLKGLVYVAPT